MIADDRIEQIKTSARAASDRHISEIQLKFLGNNDKIVSLITAEIIIAEALCPLDQIERNLVISHIVDLDRVLNDLGL